MPSKPHRGPEDPADAFDVFISFARPSGLQYAIALRDALAVRDYDAFVDVVGPQAGSSWLETVRERHRAAALTIAIITADSPKSAHQKVEVERALAWGKGNGPSHLLYPWRCPGGTAAHPWPDLSGPLHVVPFQGASLDKGAARFADFMAGVLRVLDGEDDETGLSVDLVYPPPAPPPPPQSTPHFPPAWAVEWGHDEHGPYASFAAKRVIQRMRWCPPGRFMMGAPLYEAGRHDDEGPEHEVSLTYGFWIADTPVTQALFRAVVGDHPSQHRADREALLPVERVTWDEAVGFAQRLDLQLSGDDAGRPPMQLRLPTEAEWEYACRAGTSGPSYAAPSTPLARIAWHRPNAENRTHPVGGLLPNAWGLFDMLGNVWEWCLDLGDHPRGYSGVVGGHRADPIGDRGHRRVTRGGAYDRIAGDVRCAVRGHLEPALPLGQVGLRLCIGPALHS